MKGDWIMIGAVAKLGIVAAAAITAYVVKVKSAGAANTPTNPAGIVPVAGVVPTPGAAANLSPVQAAASAMNVAIDMNGYRKRDQAIYKSFQSAAGLSPVDGFPGSDTALALGQILKTIPLPLSPKVNSAYTFSSSTGFDGVHAPTSAQWNS